ncbi:MAG: hypothetical protein IPN22_05170 [Bacteroidetes bacterium]|nr:hypothetical protein [Bacteroidota bacterium]
MGSPTITGTRSGANIAAAWAAINSIGKQGYTEMAKATMQTTERIKQFVAETEELELMGKTDMCIVAFKSATIDVYMLADELNKKDGILNGTVALPLTTYIARWSKILLLI